MAPFGEDVFRLEAQPDGEALDAVGMRLVMSDDTAIHVGLFEQRIHVQPNGVIEADVQPSGPGTRVVAYLQTLLLAEDGFAFEWRWKGARVPPQPTGPVRVMVDQGAGNEREVSDRQFRWPRAGGHHVEINIEECESMPRLELAVRGARRLEPGTWSQTPTMFAVSSGWRSFHILLRSVRATRLE